MINTIKHGINLAKHYLRDVGVSSKRSGKWEAVEKSFKEAHPACEACGSKNRLNIHHILPFHLDKSKELDTNNLITLCMDFNKECHYRLGHLSNWHGYNPNIKSDAAEALLNPTKLDEIIKRGICKVN